MNLAILALGTVFVWVTGLFYLRHVREFLRMRTDRITFELFPFARSAELHSGGFWHTILRGVHGISAILYVVRRADHVVFHGPAAVHAGPPADAGVRESR